MKTTRTYTLKEVMKAHRAVCPYKSTNMTKCGANITLKDGKCPKDKTCYYMEQFKNRLKEQSQ